MPNSIQAFITRWIASQGAERANKDLFLTELCDVLGVPRPAPSTGDPERDIYTFERDAYIVHEGKPATIGKIDFFKEGCFLLEAKQGSDKGSKKLGTARRDTAAWNIAMRDAYGQALKYARTMRRRPPFLLTCDIGYCFDLYASFDGSGIYEPFPDPHSSRIFVSDLGEHRDLLRAIFLEPQSLDPSLRAIRVTREVAAHIAELARLLEAAGHHPELVAKFLMRCLFTMFAEDVKLLPDNLFTNAIRKYWLPSPRSFPGGVQSLWKAMNEGTDFLVGKLLHFNGGLFHNPVALPLDKAGLERLLEAAECDWSEVEPAIFGTLLERALDPLERHQLGAHYTPRAYVERLVRPTIEEPLRADWDVVQAETRQLVASGKLESAKKTVRTFHQKLCSLRVLDPACGSGNFLYVTLDLFKRLEGEVLAMLQQLGETQTLLQMQTVTVTPQQFLGIEKKPWAKEIAELVLWIGYLQWHFKIYGKNLPVPEPVLKDYKNIECRDAVLTFDREELVLNEEGAPVVRWDGVTYKRSAVTGERVPNESATVPLYRYVNPRKAEWPQADFIVGNPPFIGGWKIRQARGDGYVEALWSTYPDIPEKADYVMFWWDRAARAARDGLIRRFGFITTNSISQVFQRRVLAKHLETDSRPLRIAFAIPDHPWIDSEEAAAVRVAMTVAEGSYNSVTSVRIGAVVAEEPGEEALNVTITLRTVEAINSQLRSGISSDRAKALQANSGLCSPGVQLYGAGFIVTGEDIRKWERHTNPVTGKGVVRPYVNGRDLTSISRKSYVIDFFELDQNEAMHLHPAAFQRILDRVKPERDHNRRPSIRDKWWRFGWERPVWRMASKELTRFITTPETAKHRFFLFLDAETLPDNKLTNFALDDAYYLGLLSSKIHVIWAMATGGRLGVGNDSVYNKTRCFDPYPMPVCSETQKQRIRELGTDLDVHRKRQQAIHPGLTLTGMYNVLEKLRTGEVLDSKEKVIHEQGLVSLLKKIHDDLDFAVFDVYGMSISLTDEQILERLIVLNGERTEEEANGLIRWLRPDFQNSRSEEQTQQISIGAAVDETETATLAAVPWPKKLPEQIAAVRNLLLRATLSWTASEVGSRFKGAKAKDVHSVLESLAALGLLVSFDSPQGQRWQAGPRN